MRATLRLLLVLTLAALTPTLALGDAVDPEPESCPPGSRPSTGHSGPYCAPTAECSGDAECAGGTCSEVSQCVETRACGGLRPPDAEPCTIAHVVGPCDGDGSCAIGECRSRQVCDAPAGGDGGGCGCRVGAGRHAEAEALLGLALAALVTWRRRGRRPASAATP